MRRGATVMLVSQWGRAALQIIALVVLARLLAPGDYGLVAMSAAIVGLATVVGDFGLSLAAIQAPTLSRPQRDNLFWLNVALGGVGGALIALASPLIATFYDEPRLVPLTVALAVVFLLTGCTVQFIVELNRAERFSTIGLSQFGAQFAGVATAIVAATAGAGFWALVVQQIVAGSVLLTSTAIGSGWRPGPPNRIGGIHALVRFGGGSLTSQVMGYVVSNLDSVLIGRTFSAAVLGVYNRAYTIAMIPIVQVLDPLTRVVVPRLAAAVDPAEFDARLLRLHRIVGFLSLGPLGLAAATAPDLLVVALGPAWASGAPILRILAFAAVLQAVNYVYYWAFMAKARPGLLFLAEVWGKALLVLMLFLTVGGGPVAVAWAVVAGGAAGVVGSVVVGRRIGVSALRLTRASAEPLLVFGGASLAAWLVGAVLVPPNDHLISLLVSSGAWLLWAVTIGLARPTLREEARRLVRERLGSHRSAGEPAARTIDTRPVAQ